jgi:hypothetical protein
LKQKQKPYNLYCFYQLLQETIMTLPIQNIPGSKRCSDSQQQPARRQRQNADSISSSSVECPTLPLEIWEMVAFYVQDSDLNNLSQVSLSCKQAALATKNIREMDVTLQEVQTLNNLTPESPEELSSAMDLYRDFLYSVSTDPWSSISIRADAMERLHQTLTALSTDQASRELLEVRQECYKQIHANKTSCKKIVHRYNSKKIEFILKAFDLIFPATNHPQKAIGLVLKGAAEVGCSSVLDALINNKAIAKEDLNTALYLASNSGELDAVVSIIEAHALDPIILSLAIQQAASHGHIAVMRALLAKVTISPDARGQALLDASCNGHVHIAIALLANGPIPRDYKECALRVARVQKHRELVTLFQLHLKWEPEHLKG